MVILNERSDLGRDLRSLPSHHEALSHGPASCPVSNVHSLSRDTRRTPNAHEELGRHRSQEATTMVKSRERDNQPCTYQSRSSHCGSRPSSGTASIFLIARAARAALLVRSCSYISIFLCLDLSLVSSLLVSSSLTRPIERVLCLVSSSSSSRSKWQRIPRFAHLPPHLDR